MGLNQGYMRLMNGYVKTLNISEKNRGWLFITKDKKGLELLGSEVSINYKDKVSTHPMDGYGRLLTGKDFISTLPDTFKIRWENEEIIITK